ncbi:hypothetical protein AYK26_03390 [Euryarchaeota archaeon SM23-78]|nr:MAG: hypothetical protein AYK26_03390 [Euryarchaeota archaeon SM23-78]MBW3000798.1 hypothetical protein [Candidatus Woesearchaeota archaeon]
MVILIISMAFFLTGCPPRNGRDDLDFFKGREGFELEFLEQAPPDEIFEESTFGINLFVENSGAFDVIDYNYAILSIGFDPFYIDASEFQSTTALDVRDSSLVLKGIQLPGKSIYYPRGLDAILSFPGFKTKKIMGQREQPDTQIYCSLCYPYKTQFSQLVCVDFNVFGQNLRDQVCYQEDLALSDQGAPVAITHIEVENQPISGGNAVRPVFTIQVRNVGSGNVLSPIYNAAELERVCSFQNLNREDFNTVSVRAVLSATKELECNPNPIQLFREEGLTRCQVRDQDLALGYQNYQTPLSINLSYTYRTSVSKDVSIKRLDVYGGPPGPAPECLPSEVMVGGRCISRCYACGENPTSDCQPSNSKYHINFQSGFACQCTFSTCDKLYPKGLCVPFSGYCPGTSYCCIPECRSSEVRDPTTGRCYSKCSKCSAASRDCACGTDSIGYNIISAGKYCCTENKSPYNDKASCEDACASSSG